MSQFHAALAVRVIDTFSPSIREALLSDAAFCERLKIEGVATILLPNGVSFLRAPFFDAVRSLDVRNDASVEVKDESEQSWTIKVVGLPEQD